MIDATAPISYTGPGGQRYINDGTLQYARIEDREGMAVAPLLRERMSLQGMPFFKSEAALEAFVERLVKEEYDNAMAEVSTLRHAEVGAMA